MRKLLLFSAFAMPLFATDHFVDSSVGTSGNGLSWGTAWKQVSNITGLSAGDIVYFSGGSTSQNYTQAALWAPAGGTSGNPITYKVGQDAGHNGTVNFTLGSLGSWIYRANNWTTIDGEVGGVSKMTFSGGIQASEWVVAQNTTGFVIRYVTFEDGDAINLNNSSQYEIAYCSLHSTYDHAIGLSSPPTETGFDVNKIHHNTILLDQQNNGSGNGSDGIQWGNSVSVYNNTFAAGSAVPTFPSGQHQDGYQTSGKYVKIYNNSFENMGNYGIFIECFGSCDSVRIYNNVIFMSDTRFAGGFQHGISVLRSGGATGTISFTNIVVASNSIANYGGSAVAVTMTPGASSIWDSTDLFYDNIGYNTAGFDLDTAIAGSSSGSNKSVTSGGSSMFVSYQALSGTVFAYDFHIKSGDTVLIGQGVSTPSSLFTADKDGVSRGSSWDIGAYQFTASLAVPSKTHNGNTKHSGTVK